MLPLASLLLLLAALGTALLVAVAARVLLRHRTTSERPGHFPRSGRIGLRLAASVAIALAAFTIFIEVADNVIDRDELFRGDTWIGNLVAPLRTGSGLAIARVVSMLGISITMTVLALVVVATFYRRNWRMVAIGWTLLFGGGKLVEFLLKHLFRRSRPGGSEDMSYSYPSGHAMGAMIGYGILAYLLLRRAERPATRVIITAGAALIILAVGASRLVLGVHFFTDVVGGYAAGATWLLLSIAALEAERAQFDAGMAKRGVTGA
jgi:undecaprenyl-diphosphatase